MRDHGLWKSRWAAVGAAVAVSLGSGGVFFAHAQSGEDAQPSLDEYVEIRQSTAIASIDTGKARSFVDGAQPEPAALETDAAPLTAGATFTAISPYRTFDSREYGDGLLLRGESVYFDVITDANSIPQIPASAVAVTYNLTVTGTYGSGGYLALYPPPGAWPGNSSINWFAPGLDLANGGVVALGFKDGPGQIVVQAGDVANTATDFIIDITGYYE